MNNSALPYGLDRRSRRGVMASPWEKAGEKFFPRKPRVTH